MSGLPVASAWFRSNDAGDGVTKLVEEPIDTMLESNVWLVRGSEATLLIDTGNGVGRLRPRIDELAAGRPVIAVVTHGHFDHTGGLAEFDDRRCHEADAADVREPYALTLVRERFPEGLDDLYAYYGYEAPDVLVTALPWGGFDLQAWSVPAAEPTSWVSEGDLIDLGDRTIDVLHVPGHTPGSIALWEQETALLFTGDILYADDRLSFEDAAATETSLNRLLGLPVRRVHPGHGRSIEAPEFRALIGEVLASGPEAVH